MMQFDPERKRKLLWVGVVLAPLLAVQLARLLEPTGTGPGHAHAADPASLDGGDAVTGEAAPAPLSPAQQRALAFIADMPAQPVPSPMDGPDPEPIPVTAPAAPVEAPKPASFPESLKVTAIIGDGDTAAALIAHRLRRAGDEVAPGWRVDRIDPRGRQVWFTDGDGHTVTLAPPTPVSGSR